MRQLCIRKIAGKQKTFLGGGKMQKRKTIVTLLALATILATLCALPEFQQAEAYVHTPVQAGPLYRSDYGWLCAHYGYEVAYDSTGGSSSTPYFYPSLEVVTQGWVGLNFYSIKNMKITVNGTKPDGTAISGINFGDLAQINSPKDTGTEWANALTAVWNVLKGYDPTHLTSAIIIADVSGGSVDHDSQSAWANWNWGAANIQKGLQFRFKLLCDPNLGGTYTLTIKYHMEIFVGLPASGYIVNTSDFYQTITYEYTPPYVSSITGSGWISGYADSGDETYMIGYEADSNFAYIVAYNSGAAYISGMLNTERSGQTDIYLYGFAFGVGAHVYVYVSSQPSGNWHAVNDLMIYQTNNAPIHVATTQYTYKYILICNFNDFAIGPSGIAIDCITTT
jgi:hypothetical protein